LHQSKRLEEDVVGGDEVLVGFDELPPLSSRLRMARSSASGMATSPDVSTKTLTRRMPRRGGDRVRLLGRAAGPESPRRRQRAALELDTIDGTARTEMVVETLAHDVGQRTAFALSQFLRGSGLLLGELDLGPNHAVTITDCADM